MKEDRMERGIKITLDLSMILMSYIFTCLVKYEKDWVSYVSLTDLFSYIVMVCIFFIILEIPKRSWTYTSLDGIIRIIQGVFLSTVVLSLFSMMIGSFISFYFYISLFLSGAAFCILIRYCFMLKKSMDTVVENVRVPNTLIVGAGEAGGNLLRESLHNSNFRYKVIGLIDDDPRKEDMFIQGYKVLGNTRDLPDIIEEMNINNVIIAIPSAPGDTIKRIYEVSREKGAGVKILPSFTEFLRDEPYSKLIRDVRVEDLLGREQHLINEKGINEVIQGKTIFITGGGGSIGSELSRQIAQYNPAQIINIDVNENTLYFLELELKESFTDIHIQSEICSIKDREKLSWLFEHYKPHMVFHTAAHKHVPLMEHNPEEAVKNNVFGTKNLIECSHEYGVDRFLLISTDKAVNPTSVMGATKRICEMMIQKKAQESSTKYMAVRFGNVLGSKGSVVPIFKKLIASGKNITLTHKDITRYFMTIPEAVQLVIEASTIGKGGEVFILDMGKPVKIMDLAKNLIELSGLRLKEDIDIDIVGLRPGEKLFEELLYDEDTTIKTDNKKIFIARLKQEDVHLEQSLRKIAGLIEKRDREGIKTELGRFVKTYKEPDHHYSPPSHEDDRVCS